MLTKLIANLYIIKKHLKAKTKSAQKKNFVRTM